MLLLFSPDGSTYNFQAFSSYHNTNNWYGKYYRSINTSTAPQLLHKNNTFFFHFPAVTETMIIPDIPNCVSAWSVLAARDK